MHIIIYYGVYILDPSQNWSSPVCVSWDFKAANGSGNWSEKGCTLVVSKDDKGSEIVLCRCNHLTNFGVLVVR